MAAGFPHLADQSAVLRFSYRPAADLLIGTVELSEAARSSESANWVWTAQSEQPDADTSLVWHTVTPRLSNDDTSTDDPPSVLASFEIVHAMARYEADTLSMLPRDVASAFASVARCDRAAIAECSDPLARIRYRGNHEFSLSLAALSRTEAVDTQSIPGLQRDALALARSIDRFADAFEDLAVVHHTEYPAVTRWCMLARELSSTLSERHAMPAPGTSAAVRQALRSGIPCRAESLDALRRTFELVDYPASWLEVADILDRFTHALTASGTTTCSAFREAEFV